MAKTELDNIVIWNPHWLEWLGIAPKPRKTKEPERTWESWLCPGCKTLYEEDEYDFHERPPSCPKCGDVKCEKSRRWNKPPKRKPELIGSDP